MKALKYAAVVPPSAKKANMGRAFVVVVGSDGVGLQSSLTCTCTSKFLITLCLIRVQLTKRQVVGPGVYRVSQTMQ